MIGQAIPAGKGRSRTQRQGEANRSAWVSATWDHFLCPIPNYTSDRVPISLASGIPIVDKPISLDMSLTTPPGSGLFWGKSVRSVAEMVGVVLAMPKEELLALGERAASFALRPPLSRNAHGKLARGCFCLPHCRWKGLTVNRCSPILLKAYPSGPAARRILSSSSWVWTIFGAKVALHQ